MHCTARHPHGMVVLPFCDCTSRVVVRVPVHSSTLAEVESRSQIFETRIYFELKTHALTVRPTYYRHYSRTSLDSVVPHTAFFSLFLTRSEKLLVERCRFPRRLSQALHTRVNRLSHLPLSKSWLLPFLSASIPPSKAQNKAPQRRVKIAPTTTRFTSRESPPCCCSRDAAATATRCRSKSAPVGPGGCGSAARSPGRTPRAPTLLRAPPPPVGRAPIPSIVRKTGRGGGKGGHIRVAGRGGAEGRGGIADTRKRKRHRSSRPVCARGDY